MDEAEKGQSSEHGSRPKRKSRERRKKSKEEMVLERVGFWSRLCESRGDFEVPKKEGGERGKATEGQHEESEETEVAPEEERKEDDAKERPGAPRHQFLGYKNPDRLAKEEVEADQLETENLTLADRWFCNKKVQKVVKDSKMMSHLRKTTQIKLKKLKVGQRGLESGAASNGEVPKIVGSMDEYKQLLGGAEGGGEEGAGEQGVEMGNIGRDLGEKDSDEGGEKEDELWGALMGGGGQGVSESTFTCCTFLSSAVPVSPL